MSWLLAPSEQRRIQHVASEVAKAAGILSHEGTGRSSCSSARPGSRRSPSPGVMLHSDLSHELLTTIFAPRTELHDGAVIIRGGDVLAAAALLPLTEMTLSERFGTRHRAALGITEDTDAIAVVVSEEERPDERRRAAPHRPRPDRGAAGAAPSSRCSRRRPRRPASRAAGAARPARLRIARRRIRRDPRPARPSPPCTATAGAPRWPGRRRAAGPAACGAGEPAPAPVDEPRRASARPCRREGDDDAAHRVPEVPRDEAGGTAAAAVADR
jgi:hypothetical protein